MSVRTVGAVFAAAIALAGLTACGSGETPNCQPTGRQAAFPSVFDSEGYARELGVTAEQVRNGTVVWLRCDPQFPVDDIGSPIRGFPPERSLIAVPGFGESCAVFGMEGEATGSAAQGETPTAAYVTAACPAA